MKKRIIKIFSFLLIGIILMLPINNSFLKTNGYRHLNDTDKFMNVENELEIINLGSSHGLNGFNYSDLGVNGFNMALAAQGFYYDYRILMQFSKHLKKDAVVLLPISYFSPYQKYEGSKFESFNMRYYRFLNPEYIRFFNAVDYLRYKQFPVLFAGEHIKYIFSDRNTVHGDWEAIDYNKFGNEKIATEGETRANHHIDNIINVGIDNKEIALNELKKAIEYCVENGFKPVLVTTPLHFEYKKHYDEIFLNEFMTDINNIQKDYPGLLYLDYSEFMSRETELFMDSDHLNVNGRKVFTKSIIEDLKERGLL